MKCHNHKCEFNNTSSVNNCMRPNFNKICKDFEAEQDNPPSGLNIHQPESEFETITISLHTKEAARDFFMVIHRVYTHLDKIKGILGLSEKQNKMFKKLYEFKKSGL